VLVPFDDLPQYRGLVSMVDGAFDPLHAGHIAYFNVAAAFGYPLLCNVASDAYVQTKHRPLLPQDQRVTVIDALRDITYTHLCDQDTATVLAQLRPYAYIKGLDWSGRLPPDQVEVCTRFGIRIWFLDTVSESSTRLLKAAACISY
jgi:cytidyltransferase-like protein